MINNLPGCIVSSGTKTSVRGRISTDDCFEPASGTGGNASTISPKPANLSPPFRAESGSDDEGLNVTNAIQAKMSAVMTYHTSITVSNNTILN